MTSSRDFWTAEKVAELKQLWADPEMTGDVIAEVLGAASRSAIAAKVKRLGLPVRGKSTQGGSRKPRWTPELHERLKSLWLMDVPAWEIAAQLGCGHSAKAVEVQAFRIGMPRRRTFRTHDRMYVLRSVAKNRRVRSAVRRGYVGGPRYIFENAPPRVISVPKPEPLFLTLVELEPDSCRHVERASGLSAEFCGNVTVSGSSYCRYHRELCYNTDLTEESRVRAGVGKPKRRFEEQAAHFMRWRESKMKFEFRAAA